MLTSGKMKKYQNRLPQWGSTRRTRKVKIRATICRRSERRALSKASDFKLGHRPVESAYVERCLVEQFLNGLSQKEDPRTNATCT